MDLYKAKYPNKKHGRYPKSDKNRQGQGFKDRMPSRSFRNSSSVSRSDRTKMYQATCGDCGAECEIPFEPKFNKPIYCSRCFAKNKPQKSNKPKVSEKRSEYSRRDKNPKHFNNDRTSKRPSKSPKEHNAFYPKESEKFYASLKEKLFEILGGKVCASCGFRDERALGFSHIYDGGTFDRIHRGGSASSWRKYVFEPELARKELRVLCLNCNEIREPQIKNESKPKKKSRYFPR